MLSSGDTAQHSKSWVGYAFIALSIGFSLFLGFWEGVIHERERWEVGLIRCDRPVYHRLGT
jgi:hypothetical protein